MARDSYFGSLETRLDIRLNNINPLGNMRQDASLTSMWSGLEGDKDSRGRRQNINAVKASNNLTCLIYPHQKSKTLKGLKEEFDQFQQSLRKIVTREQPPLKGMAKSISMTAPNLLRTTHHTVSKNKNGQDKWIPTPEGSLNRIEENPLDKHQTSPVPRHAWLNELYPLLESKLASYFGSLITQILHRSRKIHTNLLRLEKLTARMKYLHNKNNPKLNPELSRPFQPKSLRVVTAREGQKTPFETESPSTSTAGRESNSFESDEKLMQVSMKKLLSQEKVHNDLLVKKSRIIQLLNEQILETETRRDEQVRILEAEIEQKGIYYEAQIAKLKKQVLNSESALSSQAYLVTEVKAKNKHLTNRCLQLEIQLETNSEFRVREALENNRLKTRMGQNQSSKTETCRCSEVSSLQLQVQYLTAKLSDKQKEIAIQKRQSDAQLKEMEQEFRHIDQGFALIKAANETQKQKLSQSERQVSLLRNQLQKVRKVNRKSSIDNDREDYYNALEKSKLQCEVDQMRDKVNRLQKLLRQARSMDQKTPQTEDDSDSKSLRCQEEIHLDLNKYVNKLQNQLVLRDRKIWLLENNMSRVQSSRSQLVQSAVFSPKGGVFETETMNAQSYFSPSQDNQKNKSLTKPAESFAVVDAASLAKYF